MRIVSWNVNGLRAIFKKNFFEFIEETTPDVLCLQETKLQKEQIPPLLHEHPHTKNYHCYWHSAQQKGYSSVAIFSKEKPIDIFFGMKQDEFDREGRVITAEYSNFFLVGAYFPNAQPELKRIDYKKRFNKCFLTFVKRLEKKKPVICCGDFNVAHTRIDLARPDENANSPGFSKEEREGFSEFLKKKNKLIDVFRHFYPDKKDAYTWWSYRQQARVRNVGWRIDYFVVSEALLPSITATSILSDVMGSDHCPVELIL